MDTTICPSCDIVIHAQDFPEKVWQTSSAEYEEFDYATWLENTAKELQRLYDSLEFDMGEDYPMAYALGDVINMLTTAKVVVKLKSTNPMKEITIQVPDGKTAEWVNGVLTLVDEKDNRPVTERIKTFLDACNELGENHKLVLQYNAMSSGGWGDDIVAYAKLRIIAAALNEGWEPQFTEDAINWYPWFTFWTEEGLGNKDEEWKKDHALWLFGGNSAGGASCGLAFSYSNYAWSKAATGFSARLAVKSKELAAYFGKQFIEIWADYVGRTEK